MLTSSGHNHLGAAQYSDLCRRARYAAPSCIDKDRLSNAHTCTRHEHVPSGAESDLSCCPFRCREDVADWHQVDGISYRELRVAPRAVDTEHLGPGTEVGLIAATLSAIVATMFISNKNARSHR